MAWGGSQSDVCETRDHCFEVVSAVETILELGEISRHVFCVHRPIGANQGRHDVPKHGVDLFEGWLFNRLRAAASLNLSVCASSRCDGGETGERIAVTRATESDLPIKAIFAQPLEKVKRAFSKAERCEKSTFRTLIPVCHEG